MREIWIVRGVATDPDGRAVLGQTEWQFSDGPPGERGSSEDYLSLAEGLAATAPAVYHFAAEDALPPASEYDELYRELASTRVAMRDLIELFESYVEVPEANCSCHLNPPCGDCVEWSFAREVLETARRYAK